MDGSVSRGPVSTASTAGGSSDCFISVQEASAGGLQEAGADEPQDPIADELQEATSDEFRFYNPDSDGDFVLDPSLCDSCRKVGLGILSNLRYCEQNPSAFLEEETIFRGRFRLRDGIPYSTSSECPICATIAEAVRRNGWRSSPPVHPVLENYSSTSNGLSIRLPDDRLIQIYLLITPTAHCIKPSSGLTTPYQPLASKTSLIWHVDRTDGEIYDITGDIITFGITRNLTPMKVADTFFLDEAQVSLVKKWHSDCKETHTCQPRYSPLPKRILDIGGCEDTVSLYVSRGEPGAYATLSYCWGSGNPLETTSSNLDEHCQGIELSRFPKTLRDAILLARRLGFRYLWIDALCIIQGDEKDWSEQAAAMTDIYRHCSLNICASDSHDCDTGMLPIAPLRVIGRYSRSTKPEAKGEIVVLSPPFSLQLLGHFAHEDGCLQTRGWALQEVVVSPASVYYTSRGIEWECCHVATAQYDSPGSLSYYDRPKQMWKALGSPPPDVPDPDRCNEALAVWSILVEEYSARRLTKEDDRLPAVAGIASTMARSLNITYAAGLWKEYLAEGLTWARESKEAPTRPRDRAPSWSWASLKDAVRYPFELTIRRQAAWKAGHELLIHDVTAEEVNPGSFGQVRRGRIVVSGFTHEGALHEGKLIDGLDPSLTTIISLDEPKAFLSRLSIVCLHIVSYFWVTLPYRRSYFLLLERTGAAENEFQRVGIVIWASSGDDFYDGMVRTMTWTKLSIV